MRQNILSIVLVIILSGCTDNSALQAEQTATALAIQQEIEVTQTHVQSKQNAEIATSQTREAIPEWTVLEQDFDGIAMVQVPVGCFAMGGTAYDEEKPIHEQCFNEPFWIDKYEVSQADFARLGGVQAEPSSFLGDDRPVETITWFEARDFCELREARLPTEAEWEYAARGPRNLIYPWGDTWDENKVVWNRDYSEGTAPVGSISAGASWVGAEDMSGNVWEFTSSLFEPYPYDMTDGREADTGDSEDVLRVLRGSAWAYSKSDYLRATYRYSLTPFLAVFNVGFRCVRSD